ncbi:MAG: tetratricopeptide repeat protein [Alphaproteobacteria bacterium]|nr:tetratricopeptide repeat protein [Alphaproteobacteria bacterium]
MSYELMFQKAITLQQNGALNEAEQIYRQILETAPQNSDVLNLLGLVAQAKGIHNEAITYFYKAAEFAPKHFPIFFNLAVSLEATERHLEAIEAYTKVLQLNPQIKEAHCGIADIYWKLGNKEKAKQEFLSAIGIDNNYIEALANLADLEDNTSELQNLCEKFPSSPLAPYYLARRFFSEQKYAKAENLLLLADTLCDSDEIKTLAAQCMLASGNKTEALKFFYQAAIINSHNVTALVYIADLETENQNYTEAEKYYKKAIEIDAGNLQAHTNYANMLCKKNRPLEALEEYRQAVIISPQTPALSYNLALILKDLKEYEQSLSLMFNAYYLDSSHQDWAINLTETLTLLANESPEKAKKIAQNWYEKMPDNIFAKHIYNSVNGKAEANDKEFNRVLFDCFAPTYEETLQKINYRVVEAIKNLQIDWSGKILDLGCGSGLVGQALHNNKAQIFGVDISQKMLNLAKEKNVYFQLVQSDITEYLRHNKINFDCIIAADVFCYFTDLEEVFSLCFPHKLIFTAETDLQTDNYAVQANGRTAHNPEYIENLLHKCGYIKTNSTPLTLRNEGEKEVSGVLFVAELN